MSLEKILSISKIVDKKPVVARESKIISKKTLLRDGGSTMHAGIANSLYQKRRMIQRMI